MPGHPGAGRQQPLQRLRQGSSAPGGGGAPTPLQGLQRSLANGRRRRRVGHARHANCRRPTAAPEGRGRRFQRDLSSSTDSGL
eukprot:11826828-Alexandrium_andersonii.AAC.1